MEDFLIRYPEFSGVDANRIQLALSDAADEMSRRVWGKLYKRGLYALAAYLIYLSGAISDPDDDPGNPNRITSSESVGNVSVGYISPDIGFSSDHAGLALNKYGREYIRLGKLVNMHILVVK